MIKCMKYVLALLLIGCGGPGSEQANQQPEQQPRYAGDYYGHYLKAFPDGEQIYETSDAMLHLDLVGDVISTTMNYCELSFTQTKPETASPAAYTLSSAHCTESGAGNVFESGQLTVNSARHATVNINWSHPGLDQGSRVAVVDSFDGDKRH